MGRYLFEHLLDRVLVVFDKVIAALPRDRLAFRAAPNTMSVKELSYHVYQVVHLLVSAVETGRRDVGDLGRIPFDPAAASSPEALIAYGRAVRRYAGAVAVGLTAEQLERVIAGNPGRSGLDTIRLALEEAIHHRGQLMTCLRLLGVVPPPLYDYS